jgi:hypothetical protein
MMMKRLFLFASLALAACTYGVEPGEPTPEPATPHGGAVTDPRSDSERARPTGESFAVAPRPAETGTFVCRKGAFCEDFEDQAFSAHWSDSITTGRGKIDHAQDSASTGSGALRLSAPDSTSTAFLFQAKGDVQGEWSGALSFAFRVDQIPGIYLGGPELSVKTDDGNITVRIALRPEGLVLEQLADATCRRDRCTPTSKVIAAAQPNHWYRIALGFEVNPRQAAPYGRIEAKVDGGELQGTDLTVPFYDGSVFLRAGITQPDARRAFADLDDVSLLVR